MDSSHTITTTSSSNSSSSLPSPAQVSIRDSYKANALGATATGNAATTGNTPSVMSHGDAAGRTAGAVSILHRPPQQDGANQSKAISGDAHTGPTSAQTAPANSGSRATGAVSNTSRAVPALSGSPQGTATSKSAEASSQKHTETQPAVPAHEDAGSNRLGAASTSTTKQGLPHKEAASKPVGVSTMPTETKPVIPAPADAGSSTAKVAVVTGADKSGGIMSPKLVTLGNASSTTAYSPSHGGRSEDVQKYNLTLSR